MAVLYIYTEIPLAASAGSQDVLEGTQVYFHTPHFFQKTEDSPQNICYTFRRTFRFSSPAEQKVPAMDDTLRISPLPSRPA